MNDVPLTGEDDTGIAIRKIPARKANHIPQPRVTGPNQHKLDVTGLNIRAKIHPRTPTTRACTVAVEIKVMQSQGSLLHLSRGAIRRTAYHCRE